MKEYNNIVGAFKQYDAFDIVKLICCILVVCIHTNPLPNFFQPIYILAVPFFFMISSFLFFTKIKYMESGQQKAYLWKFTKRSMILYIFWFCALFPTSYIFFYRSWFSSGACVGVVRFIVQFLFSYTFAIPSWYLMASLIGTMLVFYMTKSNVKIFFIIALCLYILCCLFSNYFDLLNIHFDEKLWGGVRLQNSFVVSVIWIYFGYIFANEEHYLKTNILLVVLLVALLYAEYFLIRFFYGTPKCQDCYFMLVPLCYYLFPCVIKWNIKIGNGNTLRMISTIIFCVHHPISTTVGILFLHHGFRCGMLNFVITMLISLCVCLLIIQLTKNRHFQWLKYSY